MSLVSTTIPNLINGVSQQPFALRLSSQAEAQVNAYSSVVDGLRKRPPSRLVKLISTGAFGNAYIHTINRDLIERYIVVATHMNLRVFRLDGSEVAVRFPQGTSYLSSGDAAGAFQMVTVADYTFVVNKGMVVRRSATQLPARRPEAMLWVKQGAYDCTYSVNIDGNVASYHTPDGSDAKEGEAIQTDYIAARLIQQLNTMVNFTSTFDVAMMGSTIYFARKDGRDFGISTTDGQADNAMTVVKDSVQRFTELPAKAYGGFVVRIAGDSSSGFNSYYVQFKEAPGKVFGGTWEECAKPGQQGYFEGATMPWALVRDADGAFTFRMVDWAGRKVGDLDNNPFPSFVDSMVSDMFFHRNRLGIVAGENLVFSRAGETFDFFRETVTQLLDTDPIDIAVSHTKVSTLRHAIPFNETLLLFSDQTQFQLGRADLLTPQTVSVNATTHFEASLQAKPVGAGRNVYFMVNRGKFSGVREYYVDGENETNDATDITSHVPKYLPGGVTKLAASTNEDVLVAFSPRAPNALFVYRYFWQGSEKLQSSWSKWEFDVGTKVLYMDFVESDLFVLLEREGNVMLEVISLDSGAADDPFPFQVALDHRVTQAQCSMVTNSSLNIQDITLPYPLGDVTNFRVIAWENANGRRFGQEVVFTKVGPRTIRVGGGLTKFFCGFLYTMRYRFSTLVMKEDAVGGGQMTIGEGRLQLRKMSLTHTGSGYFRVEVTPFRRQTYSYVFSGRVIGSGRSVIGQPVVDEGRFRFPIMGKNDQVEIDIVNDTVLPCSFLSAEWEALYSTRSRRL